MTRDEIAVMPAGPRLDALYTCYVHGQTICSNDGVIIADGTYPSVSTDPAAGADLWKVPEGMSIEIWVGPGVVNVQLVIRGRTWIATVDRTDDPARDVQLALCRARIMAAMKDQ